MEFDTEKGKLVDKDVTRKNIFIEVANRKIKIEEYLNRAKSSLENLKSNNYHVECFTLTTNSRWLVGLGQKGALEVGLMLHPLYGYPYIPSTMLKGLTRSWLEIAEDELDGQIIENGEELHVLRQMKKTFGSASKNENAASLNKNKELINVFENQMGEVLFFDSMPTKEPKFELDIMNPHYGPYYESNGNKAPGDWYSPIPITFLTVAPKTTFWFGLASRDKSELEKSKKWLIAGLTELGVGAKTSSGYGYFTSNSNSSIDGLTSGSSNVIQVEERPDWAIEMEKETEEIVIGAEEEFKVQIDLIQRNLELDPRSSFQNALTAWKSISDEKLKAKYSKEFFIKQGEYLEKRRDKGYYKELKEWSEKT